VKPSEMSVSHGRGGIPLPEEASSWLVLQR
jgi:hypothetical protein